MKELSIERAVFRRRVFRFNILFGVVVFFAAFVLNVTGDYKGIDEIHAANQFFNYVGIGGLLYAAFFMIYCAMTKPFWFPEG